MPVAPVRRPRNDDFTRDVARRGLQAVQERRDAASVGLTERSRGLEMLDTGRYAPYATPPIYYEMMASRGVGDVAYPVTGYGRTPGGRYAGWQTAGHMGSALRGRAEYLRQMDRQIADALKAEADSILGDVMRRWDEADTESRSVTAKRQFMPHPEAVAVRPQTPGVPNPEFELLRKLDASNAAAQRRREKYTEQDLNKWLAARSAPLLEAVEVAEAVKRTPLRDYGLIAAREYGVDPYLAMGMFPEESVLRDMETQRDLESLRLFGMPYDEFEAYMRADEKAAKAAEKEAEEADWDAMNQFVYDLTQFNGEQLAQKVGVELPQLVAALSTPEYAQASDTMRQIIERGGDPDEIGLFLDQVAIENPVLYRILNTQWAPWLE